MKKIVVLSGAGISAESGLKTFRGAGGLWEGHNVMEVASPEAWVANPEMVLRFYNERRAQLKTVEPNAAHHALVELESKFDVQIITQNVDDLHERAGSKNVLHLHGQLKKIRSTGDPSLIYDCDGEIQLGDKCEKGHQLRPHIVWFGEMVPNIEIAADITSTADILIVVGTSLVVYPAAGLVNYAQPGIPKYLVDPNFSDDMSVSGVEVIKKKAGVGLVELVNSIIR
ncbi:MAG: NAD-dependent deacylase [Bacteroidia bacterium]|nr:NAD-dependent deacylase [Bacteroidia bacterium]